MPAQELWTLRVYAICANSEALDGYQPIVPEGSGNDLQPFKNSVARCPDGTVAFGAGGFITYLNAGESQGGAPHRLGDQRRGHDRGTW